MIEDILVTFHMYYDILLIMWYFANIRGQGQILHSSKQNFYDRNAQMVLYCSLYIGSNFKCHYQSCCGDLRVFVRHFRHTAEAQNHDFRTEILDKRYNCGIRKYTITLCFAPVHHSCMKMLYVKYHRSIFILKTTVVSELMVGSARNMSFYQFEGYM